MLRLILFCMVLVFAGAATQATAERRVALVMGNGAYDSVAPLLNPVNDARAIAGSLSRLGFEVFAAYDQDYGDSRETIRDFTESLSGAEVALFYYAGHGIQVNGKNYLLPTDTTLRTEADLDFGTIDLQLVVRQMDREAKTKIVILDACRNNPFELALAAAMGPARSARALSPGLAPIRASGGTLFAYATEPNNIAFDGEGQHSPFTAALLRHIETPGLEINVMMTRVRGEVFRSTAQQQRPWTSTSLIDEFYLSGSGGLATSVGGSQSIPVTPFPATPGGAEINIGTEINVGPDVIINNESWTPDSEERDPDPLETADPENFFDEDTQREFAQMAAWQKAIESGRREDFLAYIRDFPDGPFVEIAGWRLDELDRAGTDVIAALSPEQIEGNLNLSRTDKKDVQRRLAMLGHDVCGIDGVFGGGTRRALSDWQTRLGQTATGYLDLDGLKALSAGTEAAVRAWEISRREGNQTFATTNFTQPPNPEQFTITHISEAGTRTEITRHTGTLPIGAGIGRFSMTGVPGFVGLADPVVTVGADIDGNLTKTIFTMHVLDLGADEIARAMARDGAIPIRVHIGDSRANDIAFVVASEVIDQADVFWRSARSAREIAYDPTINNQLTPADLRTLMIRPKPGVTRIRGAINAIVETRVAGACRR
ncbi:MAG: caspase family protein [Pseudomonadota bacterium]